VAQAAVPEVEIGRHCKRPQVCPFYQQCWQHVDRPTIWNIPYLREQKEVLLRERGILFLADVPDDFPLTPAQRVVVEVINQKKEHIDQLAIRQKLAQLQYPLYFLDFETDDPAVPRWDGFAPFDSFPFQYSCHLLDQDGRQSHYQYLHSDETNPLAALAQSLLEHIGPIGSIIVYNVSAERGVLRQLANAFPDHVERFESMIGRLWDQLDIFKHHYEHYGFAGSHSLKSVLPVLVDDLSHKQLSVQDGEQAQVVWNRLIVCEDAAEKTQLEEQLQAYCQRDTLAMVRIHQVLVGL
jgi:hypothetical protein